jgi:uncharacterized protein (DUF2252 family)
MTRENKSTNPAEPAQRHAILDDLRRRKMAESAHAYVRGNAVHFYSWIDGARAGSLPEGPGIWICGDCHLGNLGPVSDREGHVAIQIRDLDQTVIGNPAHDLLRLGLSLATAARSSDLPGVITALMMEALVNGYEQAFDARYGEGNENTPQPTAVRVAMKQALHRSWRELARQRIAGTKPEIPLGKRFWPLSDREAAELRALFRENAGALAAMLGGRGTNAKIDLLDAAYWVKGCSSLGRVRYAVLVDIGQDCATGGDPCLVDIKEAVKAAAPRYPRVQMPRDDSERVVQGARHVSPFLGDRMLAARLGTHAVVLRELSPQDIKLDVRKLNEEDAVKAARYLALTVGCAHAKQMDAGARKAWLADLRKGHRRSGSAPSWLWQGVMELMAAHEPAYLEHCRQYALRRAARKRREAR